MRLDRLTATQRGLPKKDDHRNILDSADPDGERVSCERCVLAVPRSPPEFAEQALGQWQVAASKLLWVAVKR